eukprot:1321328-Rhodomonas_salina.2
MALRSLSLTLRAGSAVIELKERSRPGTCARDCTACKCSGLVNYTPNVVAVQGGVMLPANAYHPGCTSTDVG